MNLLIDIGNTRSKIAVWEGEKKLQEFNFKQLEIDYLEKLIKYSFHIDKAILSSVVDVDFKIINFLTNRLKNFVVLDGNTKTPIINHYRSRSTLGSDRIAAVTGANYLYPGQNLLVIDSGTAITFDWVSSEAEHLGGNISPGFDMRFLALHNFTGKLPLIDKCTQWDFVGNNTTSAIVAGVQNGIVFEVNGYIEYAQRNFDNFLVILTGGNIEYFVNQIKNPIFVHSDLLFVGLNRILNYNVED